MAPLPKLHQDAFFYDEEWTWRVDRRFMEVVVEDAKKGNFWWGTKNSATILRGLSTINKEFGTTVTYEKCEQKLKFMEMRYRTFKAIISLSGVEYDEEINFVNAKESTWEYIIYRFKIGRAYKPWGEAEWKKLSFIFSEKHTFGWKSDDFIVVDSASEDIYKENSHVEPDIAPPNPHVDFINISSDHDDSKDSEMWTYLLRDYEPAAEIDEEGDEQDGFLEVSETESLDMGGGSGGSPDKEFRSSSGSNSPIYK